MPRFDKTGPQGKGPRTGRGMGNCPPIGTAKPVAGVGRGRGLGRGMGQGYGQGYTPSTQEEKREENS